MPSEKCPSQVENHENTLNAVITANNHLTKSVAEDKKFLSDKMDDLSRKQNDLEDDLATDKDKLDENCNQRNELKKKLDGLETDMRNKLPSSGHFTWKVENFAQLQINVKSGSEKGVYSDPFYSSEFGYKMRLMLFPNGIGIGKEPHLSIALQIMKGPYDAVLKWPIEYRASFSVLDQSKHEGHFTRQMKSDCREYYGKPNAEINDGVGFPNFSNDVVTRFTILI
uniref:MATH domain-containing protein n=1 Tax=Strigamia maritima TaxID=126957 RepID=T1IH91_STRMM